jgi:hypothetical protein
VAPPPRTAHPAGARPEGRLPSGPAPRQALVKLGKDGRLTVWWRTAVYYLPRTAVTQAGQSVTSYVQESHVIADTYDCEDVRVQDAKGREVSTKELRQRLKGETLVLVATDGRPVDPLHLRLTRDDTLVLILPTLVQAPATPVLPAAVVPPAQAVPPAPAVAPPPPGMAPAGTFTSDLGFPVVPAAPSAPALPPQTISPPPSIPQR